MMSRSDIEPVSTKAYSLW